MIDFTDPVYAITIIFFIVGLQRMSHPKTAQSGILWAGIAMLLSIIITFFEPGISNLILILPAVLIGAIIGWVAAKKVEIVDMPQMVAIYNGMGAGAASAIATIELFRFSSGQFTLAIALAGAIIGNVSIAGSVIAFLKLQGWMPQRPITFKSQQPVNVFIAAVAIYFGVSYLEPSVSIISPVTTLILFVIFSLMYGFMMAFPIGGADMPVLISLFNAMTGIAVGLDGFSISNYAMVVAGILVGAAGSILTLAMAKAMNRSISNILFSAFGQIDESTRDVGGSLKTITNDDAAIMLSYASTVAIVPGFGMAAAQAQFRVRELSDMLIARGLKVFFAIHPVAGRMPGHMNVLLAEAGIPYDLLVDLDDANRDFKDVDVVLVIGANDVVNPAARVQGTALYGMPILDVDKARNIIVLKRGKGRGFAGIENDLFYLENTRMLYGDARETVTSLIQGIKKI